VAAVEKMVAWPLPLVRAARRLEQPAPQEARTATRLLVHGAKVAVAVVAQPRQDVRPLVQAVVDCAGDDADVRVPLRFARREGQRGRA